MKTTVNETFLQEDEPILQLDRPLLSIGEYAAREGVPKGIIEECGRLGIIQIRRYKGKTFVVDLPIRSYSDKRETAAMSAQTDRISELVEKFIPETPEAAEESKDAADTTAISKFAKDLFHKASRIMNKPVETNQLESTPKPAQMIHPELLEIAYGPTAVTGGEITPAGETPQADQPSQFAADIDSNGTVFESIQIDFPERLEIADEQTAAIDSEIELTEEITQLHTEATETVGQSAQPVSGNIELDENMLKPVEINFSELPEIAEEPTTAADETSLMESPPEIIQTPELQASEIIDDLTESIDEIGEIEEKPESIQLPQTAGARFGIPAAPAKPGYSWHRATVFSLICLCAAVITSIWLYADRGIQLDRLNQVYAGVQRTYNDYTQAIKHAETVQNELDNSRAQLERMRNELDNSRAQLGRIRNELDNSRAEVETVRDELVLSEQNFENTPQYDADAVEQLNEQIQELATQLTNLAENP